jgi:acyl carrier protein
VTREEIKVTVLEALAKVAPEVDPATLDMRANLLDQVDLDSMDFLSLLVGLGQTFNLEIPESDYLMLASLDGCIDYLARRTGVRPG